MGRFRSEAYYFILYFIEWLLIKQICLFIRKVEKYSFFIYIEIENKIGKNLVFFI